MQWDRVPSEGALGGLISIWNKEVLSIVEVLKSQRVLSIKFVSIVDGFTWVAANVYGLNDNSLRGAFWVSLSNFIGQWAVPWCVGGDFNMIRFPHERKGTVSFLVAWSCSQISAMITILSTFH